LQRQKIIFRDFPTVMAIITEVERLRSYLDAPSGGTAYLSHEVERLTAENEELRLLVAEYENSDYWQGRNDGYKAAEAVRP